MRQGRQGSNDPWTQEVERILMAQSHLAHRSQYAYGQASKV